MTALDQRSDPPIVVDGWRHWRKIRWPDGRVETVNSETARRLGAVENAAVNGRGGKELS